MPQKLINTLLVLVSLSALLLVWNNRNSDNVEPSEAIEHQLPAEFEQFYETFHTDSITQLEHIVFPLKGVTFDESGSPHDTIWTKAGWKTHADPRKFSESYRLTYSLLGSMIIETTAHDTYPFSMERRFSKTGDGYHLIYYKQMGPS